MSEFETFVSNLQALLRTQEPAQQTAAGSASAPTQTARTDLGAGDAIQAELARSARTTAVVSLKDAPEVEAFRNELIDGLIRVDTANQLLRLVNEVIARLLV